MLNQTSRQWLLWLHAEIIRKIVEHYTYANNNDDNNNNNIEL